MKNIIYLLSMFFLFLVSCKSNEPLPVVDNLDLELYSGTWYEIARLPNRFEKDLKLVTANYSLREDGYISVINQGFKFGDTTKLSKVNGKAWVPNPDEPAKLKVSFFWPFSAPYHVIALDSNYQFAMVGTPSRKYLWILSRNTDLDPLVYQSLIRKAEEMGFPIDQLERVY